MAEVEGTKYEVQASVALDPAGAARKAAHDLASEVRQLGARIKGADVGAMSMTRSLLATGATYLGLRALTQTFGTLVRSSVQYQSELEKTKIGLAAVTSAVDHIPIERAAEQSDRMFEKLRIDAIKSVATTQQLFEIFQGIVGPIRAAGYGMEAVRKMTLDTVSAATALGEDLPQATRDIGMMVRGQAGMHVRLFQILQSTGAIKENAEEFNKLTQHQRIERLQLALVKFAPAADRYAKSWAGITSTFKDIVQMTRSEAFSPVFTVMGKHLSDLNDRLINNQGKLRDVLHRSGEHIAGMLDHVFTRIEHGVQRIADHWDTISLRLQQTGDFLSKHASTMAHAAMIYGAAQAARPVLGSGVAALGGLLAGGAGAAAVGVKTGMITLGTMSPAASAASAAAGGGFGSLTPGGAAAAAGGGTAAGGGLLLVGAVLGGVAALATSMAEHWGEVKKQIEALLPGMNGFLQDVVEIGKSLWSILRPALGGIGTVIAAILVPAMNGLWAIIRTVVHWVRILIEGFAGLVRKVEGWFKPAGNTIWSWITENVQTTQGAVDQLTGSVKAFSDTADMLIARQNRLLRQDALAALNPEGSAVSPIFDPNNLGNTAGWSRRGPRFETPAGRSTVVNDFRGSRIEVKQEFRDADPDRVLIQMMDAITRQAETRLAANTAPALTR